jgi:hypothetical protein
LSSTTVCCTNTGIRSAAGPGCRTFACTTSGTHSRVAPRSQSPPFSKGLRRRPPLQHAYEATGDRQQLTPQRVSEGGRRACHFSARTTP